MSCGLDEWAVDAFEEGLGVFEREHLEDESFVLGREW